MIYSYVSPMIQSFVDFTLRVTRRPDVSLLVRSSEMVSMDLSQTTRSIFSSITVLCDEPIPPASQSRILLAKSLAAWCGVVMDLHGLTRVQAAVLLPMSGELPPLGGLRNVWSFL
jgi:hypothetical protein